MLGYLETQYTPHSAASSQYHHLYAWLLQMVYYLLYLRHVKNRDPIRHRLKYYEGFSRPGRCKQAALGFLIESRSHSGVPCVFYG